MTVKQRFKFKRNSLFEIKNFHTPCLKGKDAFNLQKSVITNLIVKQTSRIFGKEEKKIKNEDRQFPQGLSRHFNDLASQRWIVWWTRSLWNLPDRM